MDLNQNNNQPTNYNQYPDYSQQPQGQFIPTYNFQNNQQAYFISQQKFLKLREQKAEIRKFAQTFAFAMIGFLVISLFFSLALESFGLLDLYYNNGTFSSSVGIFYSFLTVGIPFLIAKKSLSKKQEFPTVSYSAPKPNLKTVCIIFLSVFGCLASMYITGYIQAFFESLGFSFSAGDEPKVTSIADIIALFVGTAIVPALIEEFAMRNVVMQPLRKYGNLFAIIASALVFGVFHGTPSQIPFAFLCGLFLGYAVIATDSLWSGIIIHAIVNGLSCFYYVFFYFTDEDTADNIYGIICLVIATIGFASLLIYINQYKEDFKRIISKNGLEEYSLKQKLSKFIFAPAMIIAIIIFIIQAISLIGFGSEVTM